jgi:hypothetical protein
VPSQKSSPAGDDDPLARQLAAGRSKHAQAPRGPKKSLGGEG